jgi:hypothetical protein
MTPVWDARAFEKQPGIVASWKYRGEWFPADWGFTLENSQPVFLRPRAGVIDHLTFDQALNLRDLLTTTSKMVSEGRFRRRGAT